MEKAACLYWTLPVPWAGFTSLSEDAADAAEESKTIKYQRMLLRDYAARNRMQIIKEKVFLEIAPDRGSRSIEQPIHELEAVCKDNGAVLLFCDLSPTMFRTHAAMKRALGEVGVEVIGITPKPVWIDGLYFDIHDHFSGWKEQQRERIEGKELRKARAVQEIMHGKSKGLTYREIATLLNERRLHTPQGRAWTADNVRKLVQAYPKLP